MVDSNIPALPDPPLSDSAEETSAEEPVGFAERPVGSAERPVGSAERPVGSAERPVGSAEKPGEITHLLAAMREGDEKARDDLWAVVYDELRSMAHNRLRHRHSGQTLDTTALVHEAFVKLMDPRDCPWQDRAHFLGVAAVAMRHILVDYARRGQAKKRGGDDQRVTFDELRIRVSDKATEMLDIHNALEALAELDPRLCRLVELRFFAGLTVEETAEVMKISERTVKRDWRKARAFLYRSLGSAEPDSEHGGMGGAGAVGES